MAPTRILSTQSKQNGNPAPVPVRKIGVTTRNHSSAINQITKPLLIRESRLKRKAEASPSKDKTAKRSALGNITNVSELRY